MPKTTHAAASSAVILVAFAAVLYGGRADPRMLEIVADLTLCVLSLTATLLTARAATMTLGRVRAAWVVMSASLGAFTIAEIIWTYFDLETQQAPFPSAADVFFLLFPVGACVALLLFRDRPGGVSQIRIVLDGLIVAGSMFIVSWTLVMGQIYAVGSASRIEFILLMAYPVSDLLLVTVAAVVIVSVRSSQRATVMLIAGALAAMAVADTGFAYLSAQDQYRSGSVIDIGWVAGLLLMITAATTSAPHRDDEPAGGGLPAWASALLPYAPLMLAASVVAVDRPDDIVTGPVLPVGIALMLAVLARQFLAVSENRRLLGALARQAQQDPLTGLANRALFEQRLGEAVRARVAGGAPAAVLMMDLDDFKTVNDALGHGAGDQLLVAAADRMRRAVRAGDTLARVGGDEFAVLVDGDGGDAASIAERIAEAFEAPFVIGAREVMIRPSVGIAVNDDSVPDHQAEELLRQADLAMYAAKRSGAAGIRSFADPLHFADGIGPVSEADSLQLLGELRRAIGNGELHMAYQPKVSLTTGEVVGAEALLRWSHPRRGELAADEFLPLVRRHGLMGAVNHYVIGRALDDAAQWRDASVTMPVAVNLFAPTLVDLTLPPMIAQALADRNLPPTALAIEITEHMFLGSTTRAQIVLTRLRRNGIRIAIDDFGSGYATLSYLRDLPVDEVKFDRAFIAPLLTDPRAASVVRAMIALAHELGLAAVAEGIENVETAALLRDYGCDIGQGFHFSAPLTSADLLSFLAYGAATEPASAAARSS